MRILTIVSGEYGLRHTDNIKKNGPHSWLVETWRAPQILPPVIDYPEDYLPKEFPQVDLILSFAEHRGVAELLPDIAQRTGVKAVIAAIDNEAWLPRGLARQLRGWLEKINVDCVTPKPLCSLTEKDYGVTRRQRIEYHSALISEFATLFGQPDILLTMDPLTKTIMHARVKRDAVCGCARYVAENLVGLSVEEAEEKAGLLHHHFPCMAAMGKDPDFGDTLMHVSGNVLKDNISESLKPYVQVNYILPGTRSE